MAHLPDHIVPEVLEQFLRANSLDKCCDPPGSAPFVTIEGLEKDVHQLESLLGALQKDIHHRIIALRRKRNQLTPISRLPPELICHIFEIVQLLADEGDIYDAIQCLASVSSSWCSNVLLTPQLWVHLNSSFHPSFVKTIIKRSKYSSLHIQFSPGTYDQQSEHNQVFLDLVSPHIARWKTCCSLSDSASRMLSSYEMLGSADLLESYEARICPDSDLSPPTLPTWVLQSAPQLHSLLTPYFSLPLGAQTLSQLRFIEFSATIGMEYLTSDQWLEFFSASPHLEVIHAKSYLLFEPDAAPNVPVYLSKLRSIVLRGFSTSTTGRLLSCIFPAAGTHPLVTIEEAYERPPNHTFGALFSCETTAGSLLSLVRSIRWISLECESQISDVIMKAGIQPDAEFLSLTRRFHIPQILDTLFSLFSSQLEVLSMEGPALFSTPEFLRALPSLSLLKSLTIIRPNWKLTLFSRSQDNLEDIIKSLSEPQGGADGAWLLPKLKHLAIGDEDAFKQGLRLCKDRYMVYETPRENVPVMLDTLRLSPRRLQKEDTMELGFGTGPDGRTLISLISNHGLAPEELKQRGWLP